MKPILHKKTAQAQCLLTAEDRDRLDALASARRLTRSEMLREIVLHRLDAEGSWAGTAAAPLAGQYELPYQYAVPGHEN